MSELDWLQRTVLVLGCFLAGCVLIGFGLMGESIAATSVYVTSFPLVFHGVTFGKAAFLGAGAICLGVQTHCYYWQKRLIMAVVSGIEGR